MTSCISSDDEKLPDNATTEGSSTPLNVKWATVIKSLHKHIRLTVTSVGTCENHGSPINQLPVDKEISNIPTNNTAISAILTSTADLDVLSEMKASYRRWREFRDSDEGKVLLKEYAASMCHLGKYYWEEFSDRDDSNLIKSLTSCITSHESVSSVGEKRCRVEPNSVNIVHIPFTTNCNSRQEYPHFSEKQGKYDSRVQLVCDAIRDYFFGEIVHESKSLPFKVFKKLPTIITMHMRQKRKDYFAQYHVTMPVEEEERVVMDELLILDGSYINSVDVSSLSGSISKSSARLTHALVNRFRRIGFDDHGGNSLIGQSTSSPLSLVPPLQLLDVGSCYNPFEGFLNGSAKKHPVISTSFDPCILNSTPSKNSSQFMKWPYDMYVFSPPLITAIDLCPYPDSGVMECDWLDVEFHRLTDREKGETAASIFHVISAGDNKNGDASKKNCLEFQKRDRINSSACSTIFDKLISVCESSQDVVIFCLLLSYLPTREMRLRCCYNAWRSLRNDGLLVVLSTKTQSARSADWVKPWIRTIEHIGFKVVHQQIRSKLVLLSFRKIDCPVAEVKYLSCDNSFIVNNSPSVVADERKIYSGISLSKSRDDVFKDDYLQRVFPILSSISGGLGLHDGSL